MKKLNLVIAAVLSIGILILNLGHGMAATGSMSLSPNGTSITVGSSITIAIYESADSANVVTANLSYDASKLQCNGVGGGNFSTNVIPPSCGGGSVRITRSVAPGSPALSGTNLVGTVNFSGISAGVANVSFAGGSRIVNEGVEVQSSKSGGNYTVVAAPASNTGGKGAGTSTTSPTKATSQASTANKVASSSTPQAASPSNEATPTTTPEASNTSTEQPLSSDKTEIKVAFKKHAWYAFAVVDGNKPLTAARYGVLAASLVGLIAAGIFFAKHRTAKAPNAPVSKTSKTTKKSPKKK